MPKRSVLLRLALLAVLIVAIGWAIMHRDSLDAATLESQIMGFGIWAPVVFMATYILAIVLFMPAFIFALAAGALFGPVWGPVYALSASTIGAGLAFLVARYVAADWVAQRSGPRLGKLIAGVEAEGWRFVAFVRLVPLFPFNVLNYVLGLTRIRFSHYLLATAICIAPGGIAYTYLGYAGREALAGNAGAVNKGLLALGLIAAVMFLPRLVKRLRSKSD